jgi:hypothetical protein
MKIKTLAIAAATLAVGAITSQAQVYSQNVVGYVNVIYPAGQYVLSANPLTTGNDVLSNVITSASGATTVQIWNGTGLTLVTYNANQHTWKQGTANANNTPLAPGVGFFVNAATAFTNTYTGTILANTGGGTATNALVTGYNAVGSLVPYADIVTNSSTVNLIVGGASTLEQWNVGAQAYTLFTYNGNQHTWKVGTLATNPIVHVAEGFFLNPSANTNWVQTLQ